MGSMVNLQTVLVSRLKTVHSRVVLEDSQQKIEFPYITYSLSSRDNNNRELFRFEVNVWDNSNDTTTIENLSDSIKALFDHYSYNDSNIAFHSYLEDRSMLPDTNPQIRRRHLIFDLKVYIK